MPSVRVSEFDTWRPGYGLATVSIYEASSATLASVFLDPALTQAAANPQTLAQMTENGISYGKFQASLYVGVPYELQINSVDETGIVGVPITTLEGEDASLATVIPTGASVAGNLDDILARRIDVRDYGTFLAVGQNNASATTNTNTIVAALGVAGAAGGGYVEIPAGTYQFTSFTLPPGVVLRGAGREATTLQSTQEGNVVTLSGDTAGFERITIDGVSQVTGSVGVFGANINFIHFDDVMIQRFDVGLQRYGGTGSHWYDLFISDCSTAGYQCHGYSDNGLGGAITEETWNGGKVELCAGIGIDILFKDSNVSQLIFSRIGFDTNTGTAVSIIGGQQIKFDQNCWWNGNTTNILIDDAPPIQTGLLNNPSIGIEFQDGTFGPAIAAVAASGSTAAQPATNSVIQLNDTLEAVAFRRCDFSYVSVDIDTPSNNILVQDCREITGMSFAGDTPTAWTRAKTFNRGESAGLTTGNAATIAWFVELNPGQAVYLEGKIIGRSRTTTDTGFFHIAVSAHRPGGSLLYDGATGAFTAGDIITGQTSGATAREIAVSASGSNGTLTVQDVFGTFLNNEIITDTNTGSANVNGGVVDANCALLGSVTSIRPAQLTDSNWAATFVAQGAEIQLQVTGDSSMNVEWIVNLDMVIIGS
jgi:hypothetical protein